MAKQTTSGKPPISLAPVKALSEPKPAAGAKARSRRAAPAVPAGRAPALSPP